MKKVSILIPTFKTFRWTAICINAFKEFGIPVESEIILCDNSPGHPSIKAISETSLGEGINILAGDPEFPSHGQGYQKAYEHSDGDYIFTAESDSFPNRHGWFDEYIKASADFSFIGPEMPMGGGTYIHPAGALISRKSIEAAEQWQKAHTQWVFIPGAGAKLKLSDMGYHVVAHEDWLNDLPVVDEKMRHEIELWRNVGVWQEQRCFDTETFENYMLRNGIKNWEPIPGTMSYNKIGLEPGQWISYYCQSHGTRCLKAPTHIEWMPGHEGRQAAYSTVFGGFVHVWAGSVTMVSAENMSPEVVAFKRNMMNDYFQRLPQDVREKIEKLESENP